MWSRDWRTTRVWFKIYINKIFNFLIMHVIVFYDQSKNFKHHRVYAGQAQISGMWLSILQLEQAKQFPRNFNNHTYIPFVQVLFKSSLIFLYNLYYSKLHRNSTKLLLVNIPSRKFKASFCSYQTVLYVRRTEITGPFCWNGCRSDPISKG